MSLRLKMRLEMGNDIFTRRAFLKTTGLSLTALTLSSSAIQAKSVVGKRPNILFALADDWGWPHAGAYGDKVVKTPTFDRIAAEGVLFEHAFISSPSCTPCRNSIVTGQQFYRLGEGANLHSTLDIKHPNFMFTLRDEGYQIGHWRKAWGPGSAQAGGYSEHPCGPVNNFESFMQVRDKDKPFCFWFGTTDPHRAYKKGSGGQSGIDIDKVHVPEFYPNQKEIRSDIADYYFEVQRWDNDVKKAMKLIEDAGELNNTIIVMTGDHGMPFPRCKGNLYDWGSRVPLAVCWADKIPANRTVTDFTSLTDLAPTFIEAAGLTVSKQMTGKSLLKTLLDEKSGRVDTKRDFIVFGRERHTPAQKIPSMAGYPSRAVRTDNWLLILNFEPDRWPAGVPKDSSHPMGSYSDCDAGPTKSAIADLKDDPKMARYYQLNFAKRPAIELYDCQKDPDQVNNLAGDRRYADTIEKLRRQLVDYLKRTKDPRFTDRKVMFDEYPYRKDYIKERFKEKGYI
jgi:N-sulfoglucosamine sulfohydrolase